MNLTCINSDQSVPALTKDQVYQLNRISPAGYIWVENPLGKTERKLGPYVPERFTQTDPQ